LHPPARPNDRETIVPWRPHWTDLPATAPPPPGEKAAAQAAAAPPVAGPETKQGAKAKAAQLLVKAKSRAVEERRVRAVAQVALKTANLGPLPPAATALQKKRDAAREAVKERQRKAKEQIAIAQAKKFAEARRAMPAALEQLKQAPNKAVLVSQLIKLRREQRQLFDLIGEGKSTAREVAQALRPELYTAAVKKKPPADPTTALLSDPSARVIKRVKLGQGVNKAERITLDVNGKQQEGIWKSIATEAKGLRPFINAGTYHLREAAVYQLDRMMGGETVVPPTVSRVIEGKRGSLQLFKPDATLGVEANEDIDWDGDEQLKKDARRMTLLDLVTANDDRHHMNWMVRKTPSGHRLVAIDNGLTIPDGPATRFLSPLVMPLEEHRLGQAVRFDAEQIAMLEKLEPKKVAGLLVSLGMSDSAVYGVLGRVHSLKLHGGIPIRAVDFDEESTEIVTWWVRSKWATDVSAETKTELMGIIKQARSKNP